MAKFLKQVRVSSVTHPNLYNTVVRYNDVVKVRDEDAPALLAIQVKSPLSNTMQAAFQEVSQPASFIDLSTKTKPGPALTDQEVKQVRPRTNVVNSSRSLTADDDGATLEATANVSLTIPAGLPEEFAFAVLFNSGVTVTFKSAGGVKLDGATNDVVRAASSNKMVAVVGKASEANSYVVLGT